MDISFIGYTAASVAYGVFALLLFSLQTTVQARLLFFVILVSACWAYFAANLDLVTNTYVFWYQLFEVLRYFTWYVFLLMLFDPAIARLSDQKRLRDSYTDGSGADSFNEDLNLDDTYVIRSKNFSNLLRTTLPFCAILSLLVVVNDTTGLINQPVVGVTAHLILALIGAVITEHVFRNAGAQQRWAIKYLFIGTGGIFFFDFYMYADTLLFRVVDQSLWEARGLVNLIAVPLLAIAAGRGKNWSLNLYVSRDVVLSSTAILVGGVFLLVMSVVGYYLRDFGGTWGAVAQVMVLTIAIVIIASILFSQQLRAQIRVFVGKHFYKNKYDYRVEWHQLTDELSNKVNNDHHYITAIEALAQIVDARAGLLWLADEQKVYRNVAAWRQKPLDNMESSDSSLIQFLDSRGFIITLHEFDKCSGEYSGLSLPEWIDDTLSPWLIVPLITLDKLNGFTLLSNPLVARAINWEDRDLLKTAAKQISSHLTVVKTSAALAEAKQFEVFTRLSSYMVHDLKNIASELELIAQNASRHSDNPAFVADAFATVEHASSDINRLLAQLRGRQANIEKKVQVDVVKLVEEIVTNKQAQFSTLTFENNNEECFISVEQAQLKNVLGHLIDNAQHATAKNGDVSVSIRVQNDMCVISIKDTGIGMDEGFIRTRLFKPFDTTKGNAGMGIGMYESRDFVRKLGGDVTVQSELNKGSIVSLCLPIPTIINEAE